MVTSQKKMKELNELYDDFEKKFGRINSRTNKSVFSQDQATACCVPGEI